MDVMEAGSEAASPELNHEFDRTMTAFAYTGASG